MGTVEPSESTATKSWSSRLKAAVQSMLGGKAKEETEEAIVKDFEEFFCDGTVGEYD